MTLYVAAYDTESPACLAGVREIVRRHEAHNMPATFFLVAKVLEQDRAEYTALLRDHPLFEIASHSYTHMVLRDTPDFGKAGPPDQFHREIVESKKRIEDIFQRQLVGFRTPVGSVDGLKEVPLALQLLDEAGYRYVSSLAWGPLWSLPALLVPPFTYAGQGYPNLWEFPACGWHENLLKGNNRCGPVRVGLFPPDMPETFPKHYVKSPIEEFSVNNKPFIDKAIEISAPLVTLVWHPWSLHRFDPAMTMLDITFQYVRQRRLDTGTLATLFDRLSLTGGTTVPHL